MAQLTTIERLRMLRLDVLVSRERVQEFYDDAARAMGDRGGAWRPGDLLEAVRQLETTAHLMREFEGELRRLRL